MGLSDYLIQRNVVDTEAFVVRCRVRLSVDTRLELTVHSVPSACHLDLFVPAVVFLTACCLPDSAVN